MKGTKKLDWRRSSLCNADSQTGNCLEAAAMSDGNIALRNSRFKDAIIGDPEEWEAFKAGIKRGDFDDM